MQYSNSNTKIVCASDSIDITPPVGLDIRLAGTTIIRYAKSIRDPLLASAIIVGQKTPGGKWAQGVDPIFGAALLICLDSLYVGREVTQRLENFAMKHLGIPSKRILIVASHTHSAPMLDTAKEPLGAVNPIYLEFVIKKCEKLLERISTSETFEFQLRESCSPWKGVVHRRRRWLIPHYTGPNYEGKNLISLQPVLAPNRRGPSLHRVRVWLVGPNCRAIIWSVACHPTGLPDRDVVSAEYIGEVREELKSRFGPDVTVLFLPGFAGDQRADVPRPRARPQYRRLLRSLLIGPSFYSFTRSSFQSWIDELNRSVLAAVRAAQLSAGELPVLPPSGAERHLDQGRLFRLVGEAKNLNSSPIIFKRLKLAKCLDLVAVSAEPSIEMMQYLPDAATHAVGYLGDVFGYWPTDRQIAQGGYEARRFFKSFGYASGTRFVRGAEDIFRSEIEALG